MVRIFLLCAAFALASIPGIAQVDWLPPNVEDAAAKAMVARFAEAGVEITGSDEEKLQGAIQGIRDLTSKIDGWGLDGLFERAPELPRIERPDFGNRIVATIASYGFCTLPLHPELVTTQDEKLTVVLGEFSVMLVSAFLRDRFLAGGGTDQQLKELLATEEMTQLSYDIQAKKELRDYVLAGCGPWFEEMFGD
jgi:hypothetical protein